MRQKTLSLTHGAITAALTIILIFIDRLTWGFFMSFLPLPLIIYGSYYTLKESMVVYVVTVLLAMIVPAQLPVTLAMITYGFVGMVFIYATQKQYGNKMRFLWVLIGNAINYFVMMTLFGEFFGLDFSTTLVEIETMLKISDPQMIKVLAILVISLTMIMETYVIVLSARLLQRRLNNHRK